MTRTQQEFLTTASEALDAIDERAKTLLSRLDDQAFNRCPARGSWSPGQCIEHLVKVGTIYLVPMERSLARAREMKHPPKQSNHRASIRHNPAEQFFIWLLEPPARLKLPAPPTARASGPWLDPATITSAYFDGHQALQRFILAANEVDIKRARVVSPFASQLRLSLAAAIDIMLAHERRHLWQAERAARSALT